MTRVADVHHAAQGRWRGLLAELIEPSFLDGRHHPCPICGGTDRFRFTDKARQKGDGGYYCSGCGFGDGLDLLAQYQGMSISKAMEWVMERVDTVPVQRLPKFDQTKKLRDLRKLKAVSRAIREGDTSYRYLESRGLDMAELFPKLASRSLYTVDEGGLLDTDTGQSYAGMLGLVVDVNQEPVTVHRTFLVGFDSGKVIKAGIPHNKKPMPVPEGRTLNGAAVRLFEPVDGKLAIAEGIETALAVTQFFGVPCWSTLSALGIETFELPAGINELTIFCDNDSADKETGESGLGSYTGQCAAWALVSRLRRTNRKLKLSVHAPWGGATDFLEVILNRQRTQVD